MKRVCQFSPDRLYRYTLWREWGVGTLPLLEAAARKAPDSYLMVIGLNPSTADETQDDPTIRRCIGYAKRWGFGALCMTNIFAWRETDPEKMKRQQDPIGPENDDWIVRCAADAGMILAAWGKHGSHMGRATAVRKILPSAYCLKINQDGSPVHPLYQPSDAKPITLP